MSSCPNSPWPHRAISSQGLLFESETMTSGATIASNIRSRSWPAVEDGGEEASQIDLSIDSNTEVGLEFGDDGSVRLVLVSSGEGRDRRSSCLPKFGKLQDDRKVAVKVLYEGITKRMEQFLNEVTVLSRLRHKNLVALYGCTDPESQKLLLVYELVPNGTISDHLHGQLPSLTWDVRMQIAIETAEALSYLHSREPPIIHRDVKTSNILLDDDFHAKVADLGMCRLVPWDTTSVSTLPQGTVGYRDPEYDELCKLTMKSDVYSFGVVLLELMSGKQAVDVYREETEIYLFKMAVKKILNKEMDQLVDLRIGYGSNSEISRMVSSVAALSCVCLQPKADPRPPMVEVLQILKGIRDGIYYAC